MSTSNLLDELDAHREQIIEGLHAKLGDHGATTEELEAVLEALGDALWSATQADDLARSGADLGRKQRSQAKRKSALEAATNALISLARAK